MTSPSNTSPATLPGQALWGMMQPFWEFSTDMAQHAILYGDVMRQHGDNYRAHMAVALPNVLSYATTTVLDGRELERPVNYLQLEIAPPEGVKVDPGKRPFVEVDPRAGLRAGHRRLQGR
ncbi:MAG: DUF3141 domain-containing protein [Sphingomonadales bacterium]|nr:DUF3141 domain-containing protein [Sphingomonadales bacterium]MDE2170474.1 DUF3141 domain-containing protein [Sphingomonadales bacterium]